MQFYKFVGWMPEEEESEEKERSSRRRKKRIRSHAVGEEPRGIAYIENGGSRVVIFVGSTNGNELTCGVISEGDIALGKEIKSFARGLGLAKVSDEIEEVTFHRINSMLEEASNLDVIGNEDEIWEYFNLYGMTRYRCKEIICEDKMCDAVPREKIETLATACSTGDSLSEELARIYASPANRKTAGHPVHYVIETEDETAEEESCKLLAGALHQAGRVRNKCYTVMNLISNDNYPQAVLESIYRINTGGAVVIRWHESRMAVGSRGMIVPESVENLLSVIRRYRDRVQTVLCLPPCCHRTIEDVKEGLPGVTFVEITENIRSGDAAKDCLREYAKANRVRCDRELFGGMEDGREYSVTELKQTFDDWYHKKLKNVVYPAYRNINTVVSTKPKGTAYDELMGMIGLTEAKKVIGQAFNFAKAQKLYGDRMQAAGKPSFHMMFTGSPGTAKTTVARLFAKLMKENGLLPKGQMVEVGRGDLVGMYVGWTAKIVKKKFEEASGGVLFIDEAYSLADRNGGSFGDEAINTIVQEMENHRDNTIVIFAGYPKEMADFIAKNPGLRSRIAYHVPFADYDTDELCKIADLIAQKKGLTLTDGAREKLVHVFDSARTEDDFGNGRFVRNTIEQALICRASRLMAEGVCDDAAITTIDGDDIVFVPAEKPAKHALGFC